MAEVYVPLSYIENQRRLLGESVNLRDANTLLHYTTSARQDRHDRDRLMNDIMEKIINCLNNIIVNKLRTQLPDDDFCIKQCWNVITGMPVDELRKLLKKLSLETLNDSQKVHSVLNCV